MSDRIARAEELYHRLEDLYQSMPSRKGSPDMKEGILLRFVPDGRADLFARELIDLFLSTPSEDRKDHAFRPGRVYCYNCESSDCRHASPPDHLSVFLGYTPTGFPLWTEFYNLLLDARDPRIDDLLQEEPQIVSLCQGRDALKEEQLQIFGKESGLYDIMGQVVAGYFPFPRGAGGSRTALTIQAIRCVIRSRPTLHLNLIGRLPEGADLMGHLKGSPEQELEGLLTAAQKKLKALELKLRSPSSRKGKEAVYSKVLPILRQLARGLERTFRRRRRRTRHAMERREERPAVGLALRDVIKASSPESFLYDELHHTFIVLGPKWRVHVFGEDGRHVTSMTLTREGVRKRIDTRRWRYANRDEVEKVRTRVKAASKLTSGGPP